MRGSSIVLLVAAIGCKDAAETAPPPPPPPAPVIAPAPPPTPLEEAAKLGTIEAWDAAAAKLAACTELTPACREAARDAVTARGQALKREFANDPGSPLVPIPLPPRAAALVAACDAFARRAEPGDPELPPIELIAAREQATYGWLALAIPRYEEILREHRDSAAAALALPALLEALRRQGRAADLRRWVDSLRADMRFMSAHPDLRELLESLHDLR